MPTDQPIDLIAVPRIKFGPLTIEPPRRRIIHDDGREEFLEPRVMKVLVALAAEPGAILSRSALTLQCWDGQVVGDDAINRVMSRLRHVSREIGAGVFRLETITKVGFRLVVSDEAPGVASRAAAASDPVSEWQPTPQPRGVEPMADFAPTAPPAKPSAAPSRRRLFLPILGAGALGVGALATGRMSRLWDPGARAVPQLQISTPSEPGAATQRFEDDLHQELVGAVSAGAAVRLLAEDAKPPMGPSAFRLSAVARSMGPQLRVSFTLSRGSPATVIWSGVTDRPGPDPTTARQLAIRASATVRCILGAVAAYRGRIADSALSQYAGYCGEAQSQSGESMARMAVALRRTVAEAPDFAAAWSALAQVIADQSVYPTRLWDAGGRDEAVNAADRALRLDRRSGQAHMARAMLLPFTDPVARERELIAAIRDEDPLGDSHASYARFLLNVGRARLAAVQAERAYNLDPVNLEPATRLVEALYMLGHTAEADALAARIEEASPGSAKLTLHRLWAALWNGHADVAVALLRSGRYDEAIRIVGPDTTTGGGLAGPAISAFEALRSGSAAARAAAADELVRRAAELRTLDPFEPVALAALGRDGDALRAEDAVLAHWSTSMVFLLFTPPFEHARRTPEFAALAQRLGLVAYWRRSGAAPDFCSEAPAPPICATLAH